MSLVNAETGELLAEMTPDEARSLTDRIKTALGVSWELITDAYQRRAWAALGFASWDAYCSAEFGAYRLKLPAEDRQEVVASLRESGMSIRAIAAATGASPYTVQRDLKSGVPDEHTSPALPPAVDPEASSSVDPAGEGQEGPGASPQRPAPTVTGTDGKQYPAAPTAPAKPRRGSLTESANKAGWEFRRAVERLERICSDDRFPANRDQVAAALRGHLTYATEVLPDLLSGFDTDPTEDR